MSESPRKVWKVSPGEKAWCWEQFLKQKRIGIGWQLSNHLDYKTKQQMAKALEKKGEKKGSARSGASQIFRFTYDIQKKDIIIANKGQRVVVGVGIVKSDYIPPKDSLTIWGKELDYKHSRKVDWVITDEVQVPFNFLGLTVTPVTTQQWQQIKTAYLRRYPGPEMEGKLRKLEEGMEIANNIVEKPRLFQELNDLLSQTRNIILYGPPGVGKTWLVNHFATYFLLYHNVSPEKAEMYWQAVLDGDVAACQELRSQVCAESEVGQAEPAYWWISANEKMWTWKKLFEDGEQFFTAR